MKAISMYGGHTSEVFFAASMCIVVGSLVGGFALFFSLEPVDFIQMSYFLMFGLMLAVLDTPFLHGSKPLMDAKMYIGKYVQFATRLTGKGITLIFLGSALFMTMWDNLEGGIMMFLSVVLCLTPGVVGIYGVVVGLLKSSKLDKARRQVQMVIDQRFDYFAHTRGGPSGGLNMTEFNSLTMENGGFKFDPSDLRLIFNALISNPSWRGYNAQHATGNMPEEPRIPKQDLLDWCAGGMVLL